VRAAEGISGPHFLSTPRWITHQKVVMIANDEYHLELNFHEMSFDHASGDSCYYPILASILIM
jgi:hypothetical protein